MGNAATGWRRNWATEIQCPDCRRVVFSPGTIFSKDALLGKHDARCGDVDLTEAEEGMTRLGPRH